MDDIYEIECDLCESKCEVYVDPNHDYAPEYCPMCASPLADK